MSPRTADAAYFSLVFALLLLGFAAIFSFGFPLLVLGIVLIAVSGRRHDAVVFWPPVLAVVGLVAGFLAVAPLGCTATESDADVAGTTVCRNLLGIDYSGRGTYNPPLLPGLLAGIAVAVVVAIVARRLLRSRRAG